MPKKRAWWSVNIPGISFFIVYLKFKNELIKSELVQPGKSSHL
jgi:hypothetical protein